MTHAAQFVEFRSLT